VSLSAPGAEEELVDRLRANALLLQEDEDNRARRRTSSRRRVPITPGLSARSTNSGISPPWCGSRWMGAKPRISRRFPFPRGSSGSRSPIEPGPTYSFGTTEIARLPGNTELPDDFRPGGAASTPVLRDATSAAIDRWRETGRAVAEVSGQSITARHGDATLDARIAITPGPVVSFGQLIPRDRSACVPSASWKSPACPRV
jgi:translocation and assembly module TamA